MSLYPPPTLRIQQGEILPRSLASKGKERDADAVFILGAASQTPRKK